MKITNDFLNEKNHNQEDLEILIDKVKKYTKEHVKEKRFEHSKRVADMCVFLCKRFGIDEKKGYLAGIGHDMCKDFSNERMCELALKDGNPISDFEIRTPSLLHGRAAAVMMNEKFGITDPDILEAVANHVSCKIGICDLGKILFISDKVEPGRPQSTDEYREKLFKLELDEILETVLIENYEYVKGKGFVVYPDTKKMIEYYNKK